VGVGYPITATFSAPVQHKADAERHMHVWVNNVWSRGAWYWKDSRTAIFRQQSFWPGHARIDVRLTLKGVVLQRTSGRLYVGATGTTRVHTIRTGHSFIARVNAKTDRMVISVDGKVVKNFGVSLGKAGFETRSGIKTTMDKYVTRNMTSQELGLTTEHYNLWAPFAVRITYSGEFVHGAPWAAGRIGRWNGSHGCTNLLTSSAKWFYDNTLVGDVVITTGTSKSMEYWNSIGGVYNMPWSQWLAKSALRGAFA
jgi:lipoprotein-anchoring transpeptidase ErfK/SrfK